MFIIRRYDVTIPFFAYIRVENERSVCCSYRCYGTALMKEKKNGRNVEKNIV